MTNKANQFVCEACGAKFPQWSGRCGHCGEWSSLKEETSKKLDKRALTPQAVARLDEIEVSEEKDRWPTGVVEFDRVMGGGIVTASFGLLGGAPGIGKSTLILQLLARLCGLGKSVLYVSGEESKGQIKQRALRLEIARQEVMVLTATSLEEIFERLEEVKPDFLVVDSIQTLYAEQIQASAGSLSQVRETASLLMRYAKHKGVTVLLIGHITKEGDLAGPKTLEHMVDYVLYLEGEKNENIRVLRTVKNRFGNISEVGLFKMTEKGLAEIKNPNALFVEERNSDHPGSAVFAAKEGTRILFLEVQVLVGDTQQNYPVRASVGIDKNRLQLIVAVIEKYLGLDFSRNDIYFNLAGGLKVGEPGLDLAITAALLSSKTSRSLPKSAVFIGELALNGEIRKVSATSDRIKEAARLGFKEAFVPESASRPKNNQKSPLTLRYVKDIQALFDLIR